MQSGGGLRRELEEVGEIHLCRQLECKAKHALHIQEFAGIDHEALLELHRYTHGSPRFIGLGRGVWRIHSGAHCALGPMLLPPMLCKKGEPCHKR